MVAHTYVSAVEPSGEGFFLLHRRAAQGRGQQQRSSVGGRGGGCSDSPAAPAESEARPPARTRRRSRSPGSGCRPAPPSVASSPRSDSSVLVTGWQCPARPVVDRCAGDLDRAGVGAPAVALESSRRSGDLLYPPTWVRPPPFAGGLPVMARPGIPAMI